VKDRGDALLQELQKLIECVWIRFIRSRGTQLNAENYLRSNASEETLTAASGSGTKLQLAFD
jgi:hypothetical protein